MRKISLFILCLITLPMMAGGDIVKGIVRDEQGNPMPFVTISALRADSVLLTGAITDDEGKYTLEVPKNAILQASFIGFHSQTGGPDFILREETERLQEVEVKAKRPLIERQLDKLVVNVSESPIATGSSLSNVLKRAPGVRIDKDGNVTVNGKSVEIYVDGRPSYMSGEQLKGLLDGTDGGTIEKIEIITNPSAKYDASGQGGIINIKLKRNKMRGLNGTLIAAYGGMYYGDIKRWLNQDYVSLNLNYRGEKTYTNIQLNQVYADIAQRLEISTATPDTNVVTINEYKGDFQMYNLQASNDWMIDSVNTFGFIFKAPIVQVGIQSDIARYKTYMPQHTANLNYTHIFNESLQRELTANIDYSHNNNQSTNWMQQEPPIAGLTQLDIETGQQADIAAAKLDFQTMFWKTGMLEAGVKYAYSHTDNQMNTDSTFVGMLCHSDTRFRYSENVAAAYLTAAKQFGKHVNIKLGLRGEYTYSTGDWLSADTTNHYSYFNLFPSAFIGYNPTDKWALSASYTRRIKRPTYYNLNPFRTYIDAHHYQAGNPELTPEFNNDVQLQLGWSQFVSLSGIFSHTTDMFNQHMTVLPNGDGYLTWTNFGTCTTHGVNVSFTEIPLIPKKDAAGKRKMENGGWLTMTVNAGYYNFLNKSYDHTYRNQNHYWNMNATLTAYLPKMWTLTLDGRYSGPMTVGYSKQGANYGMEFGVRKVFPEKGVILNLQVQDVLRSGLYHEEGMGMTEGTSSYQNANPRIQRVTLSVVYNFGKQEWHKQRKVGNMEENSRLGGGGASGMGK